jgi:hypothetical protein
MSTNRPKEVADYTSALIQQFFVMNGPRLWRSPAAAYDYGNRIRTSKPHLDANSNTLRLGSATAAVRCSHALRMFVRTARK